MWRVAYPAERYLAQLGGLLLIDDSAPMREAIERLLGSDFGPVYSEWDGDKVLARALALMPEVIVLDISLPGISGLALLPILRKMHVDASIVMLTNHDSDLYRKQAFADGADAYVVKSRANEDLVPAILAGRRNRIAAADHQCISVGAR